MNTIATILGISVLIQSVYFWIKLKVKKPIKRSFEAFESVANNKCLCESPCNEICEPKQTIKSYKL